MSDVRSPTLRRREFGMRLRGLRLARGLTVEQVAEQLLCSPSKVSRMETGQRGATLRDVRDLCQIYSLSDLSQVKYLIGLVREAKQQAWWQSYDRDYYASYVGPLPLRVVLDEVVLHRVVGGPDVMGGQLHHLNEIAKQPGATLQVLPFSIGAHLAMESNFNILQFDSPTLIAVYVEGLVGWVFLERENDVRKYEQVFKYPCEVALNPQ